MGLFGCKMFFSQMGPYSENDTDIILLHIDNREVYTCSNSLGMLASGATSCGNVSLLPKLVIFIWNIEGLKTVLWTL